MKRFFAIALATLSLCATTVTPAFAAETTDVVSQNNTATETVDYTNYDFPDDAIVLYQGEDGVVYQSNSEKASVARAMKYNGVWIGAGKYSTGNFHVENPHTIVNKTSGTFKVESDYAQATAQFVLHDGIFTLANKTIKASDGDVHFEFQSHTKDLVVSYFVNKASKSAGMRLNCWLW